jgi:hypothetical protein
LSDFGNTAFGPNDNAWGQSGTLWRSEGWSEKTLCALVFTAEIATIRLED